MRRGVEAHGKPIGRLAHDIGDNPADIVEITDNLLVKAGLFGGDDEGAVAGNVGGLERVIDILADQEAARQLELDAFVPAPVAPRKLARGSARGG